MQNVAKKTFNFNRFRFLLCRAMAVPSTLGNAFLCALFIDGGNDCIEKTNIVILLHNESRIRTILSLAFSCALVHHSGQPLHVNIGEQPV